MSSGSDPILFYRVSDDYGCFSNFAPYSVRLKGKIWPTTEHYFQAQKFAGTAEESKIRKAKSPMLAARLGRDRSKKLRPDWESKKVAIMRDAVLAKFTQHPELAEILLATCERRIVHTANDDFWGDGGDGRGRNMLGQILMSVREELRRARD